MKTFYQFITESFTSDRAFHIHNSLKAFYEKVKGNRHYDAGMSSERLIKGASDVVAQVQQLFAVLAEEVTEDRRMPLLKPHVENFQRKVNKWIGDLQSNSHSYSEEHTRVNLWHEFLSLEFILSRAYEIFHDHYAAIDHYGAMRVLPRVRGT